MAEKDALPVELVQLQWKILPVQLHSESEYEFHLPEAIEELKGRDPEDVHVLALAESKGLPIWSNDRDLAKVGVECFTTAMLLRILEEQSKK